MRILDKSRPYGHIVGSSSGAVYEQDGLIFNARGICIDDSEIEKAIDAFEPQDTATSDPIPPAIETDQEEEVQSDQSSEDIALGMAIDGKTEADIKAATGLHHNKIKKIIRDAQT